jgi:hypothetical protein
VEDFKYLGINLAHQNSISVEINSRLESGDACYNYFFIVYCELQSTQLDRVISKGEVRKRIAAGTIYRWFTGVVLLGRLYPHYLGVKVAGG